MQKKEKDLFTEANEVSNSDSIIMKTESTQLDVPKEKLQLTPQESLDVTFAEYYPELVDSPLTNHQKWDYILAKVCPEQWKLVGDKLVMR